MSEKEEIGLIDGDKLKQWIKQHKVHIPFQLPGITMSCYYEAIRVDDVAEFWETLSSCRVPIQPVAKIEAAIRFLEPKCSDFVQDVKTYIPPPRMFSAGELADLLRWVLRRKEKAWSDLDGLIKADFGLEGGEEE